MVDNDTTNAPMASPQLLDLSTDDTESSFMCASHRQAQAWVKCVHTAFCQREAGIFTKGTES